MPPIVTACIALIDHPVEIFDYHNNYYYYYQIFRRLTKFCSKFSFALTRDSPLEVPGSILGFTGFALISRAGMSLADL